MVKLRHAFRHLFRRRRKKGRPEPTFFAPQVWTDPGEKLKLLGPSPSILVVKLDHIGDFITALAACERLRSAFPTSRIGLLCSPYNRDLAETTGLFDVVHTCDFLDSLERTPRRADMNDAAALASQGLPAYDIAVDLRHDDDTRALLWGLKAKVRVAFASRERIYPLDIALPEMEVTGRETGLYAPVGAATRLTLLVEALVGIHRAATIGYRGPLGDGQETPFPQGYVVMVVGSRLPIKRWFADGWSQVAQAIVAQTSLGIVLLGRAEELEDSGAVAEGLPPERVLDLTGQRALVSIPSLVRGASALIGLDSGLSHMAASFAVPTVVLFSGFAEIRVWAPVGPRTIVLRTDTECAPCLLPADTLCQHERRCMSAITPAMVLEALREVAECAQLKGLEVPAAAPGAGELAFPSGTAQEGAGAAYAASRVRRPSAGAFEVFVPDLPVEPPHVAVSEVTVVFVTYNSGAVIARAVGSVPAGCAVVIVDNASPEGVAWAADLPRPAELVLKARNVGFGAACNAGARHAKSRYVLFLNPDAVLEPGAVEKLLAAAATYGAPAILMPTIVSEGGRPMRKEGSVFEAVARSARLSPKEVAGDYCTRFVHGAAFMMERDTFLDMGGFDEAIFLYHEDDDLSLRAIARRIPITVIAEARAVHRGGGSSARTLSHTFRVNRAKKRSELYLFKKYGRSRSRARDALVLAGGCLLAALLFNPHRAMIRAGKLAGVLEPRGSGEGGAGL